MWREKMSGKPHFIRHFEMIQLYPIREQENNRKAFEGASIEPTNKNILPMVRLELTTPGLQTQCSNH